MGDHPAEAGGRVTNAAVAARLRRIAGELAELADTLEGDEPEQTTPRPVRRKQRWTGPVNPAIRQQREEAFLRYFTLSMSLGRDPTRKYFSVLHNLSTSEISRWLSDKPRGIAPGSQPDVSIWRALKADIARLETAAKRQGTMQIPNSEPRISPIMTA
jgi:hypothetical protein